MLRTSLAALCAAALLTGCATTGPAPTARVTAYRGLIDAEAAFNGAVNAARTAETTGLLAGAERDRAEALIRQAYNAVVLARAAVAAGDQPNVASITNLVVKIVAMTPRT